MKFIDAAKALFARQEVDNTAPEESTDEADVGFGSFSTTSRARRRSSSLHGVRFAIRANQAPGR